MIEISNNAKDYRSFATNYFENIELRAQPKTYNLDPIFIDLNRLFANFSTSVRGLTSLVESKIKSTYEAASSEYEKFERLRTSFYDSYFSYRFIYYIRNFALHYQYPIHFINLEFENYTNGSPSKKTMQVMFDKSHLLKNKEFAKKMRKDLADYGEKFPVDPIIEDCLKWLDNYFMIFVNIERTKYEKTITILESVGNIYDYDNLGISVKEQAEGNLFKISTKEIPIKLITEIKGSLTRNDIL